MQNSAIKIALFILLLTGYVFAYSSEDLYHFNSEKDQERFANLITEIRCVVCQNQNIADSNAPIAEDLREKIYHMIMLKKSDEEIKNYLENRYGEFIFLRPRFKSSTFFLWIFPVCGLIFASFYLLKTLKFNR